MHANQIYADKIHIYIITHKNMNRVYTVVLRSRLPLQVSSASLVSLQALITWCGPYNLIQVLALCSDAGICKAWTEVDWEGTGDHVRAG